MIAWPGVAKEVARNEYIQRILRRLTGQDSLMPWMEM